MTRFTRYANLTDDDRDAICLTFRSYRELCCGDVGHAIACTASSVLCRDNDRTWNSKLGTDAFAATLAVLMMRNKITLAWATEVKDSEIVKNPAKIVLDNS